MNKTHILCVVCVLASYLLATTSKAALLSSSDTLRLEFSHNFSSLQNEDTLFYTGPGFGSAFNNPFISVVTAPSSAIIHSLYDEGILLGTYTQTISFENQFVAAWASPTSLFTSLSPTITDLSTIENGTSNAYIDIRLTSGTLDIDLANWVDNALRFIEADSTNGGPGVANALQLTNLSIVSAVPIPAAAWLFGSGLLALIGIARRKKAA